VLPDGEQFKTLDSLNAIITALLQRRFERGCTLVALGGGVIGDLTGFAAACYQRGVDYVQVPTSLLAQVDSAVGGKTAVNHALGKNMIGAFHQPCAVIADTNTLDTLDDRQIRAGIAEVIKYGLIRDPEFFDWLEENIAALLARQPKALTHAIRRSCQNKAAVVAEDEREAGVRAILNLGHTFGHAIETALGYGTWLHGEAIAAGMCMASALSFRLGWISGEDHERVRALIKRSGLPTWPPESLDPETIMIAMSVDKKNRRGRIRLVLLSGIGMARISQEYDEEALRETLAVRPDP
jgi:3-dehydroquinate synthase